MYGSSVLRKISQPFWDTYNELDKKVCVIFYYKALSCLHDVVALMETLAGPEKKMVVRMSICRSFALEKLQ